MITIDFCIEEDGYIFLDSYDAYSEAQIHSILKDEGVITPGQAGEIYMDGDELHAIDIH